MTKFCCFCIQQVTWWIVCYVFAYPNLPASLKVWNYLICISQTNRWKTITTSGSLILQMWCVHFETRSMTPQFLQWLEPVKSDDLPNYYRIRIRTSENYSLRVNWAMLGSWATHQWSISSWNAYYFMRYGLFMFCCFQTRHSGSEVCFCLWSKTRRFFQLYSMFHSHITHCDTHAFE